MKSKPLFLAAAAAIALPACVKHLDLGQIVQQDIVKSCPILQMWSVDPANPDTAGDEIVVHYTAAGNPVEMLHVKGSNSADLQDFHFRYDRFNRLTDFQMNPSISPAALEWHTYTYPSNKVVVDSVYGENDPAAIIAARPNPDAFSGVITHLLDNDRRIVEDLANWYNGSFRDTTYFQYDEWGNLIRQGAVYDNKYNPYLTNDVWRFIYEDYSVNNLLRGPFPPVVITQYNARGLPEIMGGFGWVNLFRYEFLPGMKIVYGCHGQPDPQLKEQGYY